MTTIKGTPRAYYLRHPEIDTPPLAVEFINDWWDDGRKVGLCLQFPGEHFYRYLTYAEIQELQASEDRAAALALAEGRADSDLLLAEFFGE